VRIRSLAPDATEAVATISAQSISEIRSVNRLRNTAESSKIAIRNDVAAVICTSLIEWPLLHSWGPSEFRVGISEVLKSLGHRRPPCSPALNRAGLRAGQALAIDHLQQSPFSSVFRLSGAAIGRGLIRTVVGELESGRTPSLGVTNGRGPVSAAACSHNSQNTRRTQADAQKRSESLMTIELWNRSAPR
jgi:hypothetical protein